MITGASETVITDRSKGNVKIQSVRGNLEIGLGVDLLLDVGNVQLNSTVDGDQGPEVVRQSTPQRALWMELWFRHRLVEEASWPNPRKGVSHGVSRVDWKEQLVPAWGVVVAKRKESTSWVVGRSLLEASPSRAGRKLSRI